MTFENTDNSWQYFQFKQSGKRKAWMGLNHKNEFCVNKESGGSIALTGGTTINGKTQYSLGLRGPHDKGKLNFEVLDGFHRIAFHQLRFYDWEVKRDVITIENGNISAVGKLTINSLTVNSTTEMKQNASIRGKLYVDQRLEARNDLLVKGSANFNTLNVDSTASFDGKVGIGTTNDTVGEAVDIFDFTLSDGGSGDGLAMLVSEIVVNASGTTSDTQRDQLTVRHPVR